MKRISVALVSLLLVGCTYQSPAATKATSESPTPSPTHTSSPAQTPSAGSEPSVVETTLSQIVEPEQENVLVELLAALKISPEFQSGYDRDLFQHWIDADSDGCNTRREVLIIESTSEPHIGERCAVFGSWVSLYDNRRVSDPGELDIDHMVPLAEAWRSGAYQWSSETRKRFANDLGFSGSLIAVTASSNRSKSDRDPASWLPSNTPYLCQYTYDWLAVKYRWSLTIDSDEALALAELVPNCPGDYSIPNKAEIVIAPSQPAPRSTKAGEDPRFGTCREAKANGYGPYVRGVHSEYDWYRDGDSDGTVCE